MKYPEWLESRADKLAYDLGKAEGLMIIIRIRAESALKHGSEEYLREMMTEIVGICAAVPDSASHSVQDDEEALAEAQESIWSEAGKAVEE